MSSAGKPSLLGRARYELGANPSIEGTCNIWLRQRRPPLMSNVRPLQLHMRTCLTRLLVVLVALGCAHDPAANSDPTCHIASPPPTAGESSVHAQLFKVYPRKAALAEEFNGCQTIWLYAPGEAGANGAPIDFIRYYFQHGKVVATRIEGAVCSYYSTGAPQSGNGPSCPRTAPEAIPSQPAGCLLQRQSRVGQSCSDDA